MLNSATQDQHRPTREAALRAQRMQHNDVQPGKARKHIRGKKVGTTERGGYGMQIVRVVGVHGIGQSKTSRQRLILDWRRALRRGIDSLPDGVACATSLEVPHWTALLAKGTDRLGPEDDLFDESVPMEPAEEEFLAEVFADLVRPEDVAFAETQPVTTLGPPKMWSPRLTRLAMAYDRRFQGGGGRFLVRRMREVRYYLTKPDLATEVRAFVRDEFDLNTTVVIGHSLGSVIAYDLLRHQEVGAAGTPGPAIHTLVTCGSPLGIPAVRRLMGITDGTPLQLDSHIRWVNVFDPNDFITGGAGLSAVASGLTEAQVDNGIGDPHAALRYLRTTPVARAVVGGRQ
ncbi:endopeptidase [Streptomyces cyaneofuscatus]|uniref:endopeptidase n=1 Tax=Streptomyces cyaneofuscatus TaxID=66883 RepID=UPI0033B1CA9E